MDSLFSGKNHTNSSRIDIKLIIPIKEIAELIEITTGEYISRAKILQSTENIKSRLSEEGYAFAKINAMPEKNKEND